MKDQVRWIKTSLASKDVVAAMTYYLVKDGYIHAHNGRMTAACPIDEDESFLVSGPEVEEVLNRLPGDAVLVVGEQDITLKCGRFRGKIQTLDPECWNFPIPEGDWETIPADLCLAMKELRPFISDNATKPWAACLCIREGMIYATNNICCARKAFSVSYEQDIMIPLWAIDFILEKPEAPAQWMVRENYLAFRWQDGSFMRTQLVNDEYPQQIEGVISKAKESTSEEGMIPCEITPEWLEAFETVASSSDGTLQIDGQKIIATRTKMDMEAEIETPLQIDTWWDPNFIGAALRAANRFYPCGWPKPCYFEGDYIDGAIMGRMS